MLAKTIEAEVDERGSGWDGRVAVLARRLQARRLARNRVLVIEPKRASEALKRRSGRVRLSHVMGPISSTRRGELRPR
jgi:hypothetical protein